MKILYLDNEKLNSAISNNFCFKKTWTNNISDTVL